MKQNEIMLEAIRKELANRSDEFENTVVETVYFGGGTPSILTIEEVLELFKVVYDNYRIDTSAEITFEANPDDLNSGYLNNIRLYTPVNRLSIGVQSFIDRDLFFLNRRHTAEYARNAITRAKENGFANLNIDLIYGIPGMSIADWQENLRIFGQFDTPHLSAYHLTIEPKTVFGNFLKKGKIKAVEEESSLEQFRILMDFANEYGFDQYEISNFARPGFMSKHNLGYWTRKPYMGIGPSAHSYDGKKRRWNVSNNTGYIQAIQNNTTGCFEVEVIDVQKAYNEYLLTSLRTRWGIDTDYIQKSFGEEYADLCAKEARLFIDQGFLRQEQSILYLSTKGKLAADYVISAMMKV